MKRLLMITFLSLVWTFGIAVIDANAQTAYGISIVRYNTSSRIVDGYSGTWLDYNAGYYYDPYVDGEIYRPDNEVIYARGQSLGFADIVPAEVYLATFNFVEGRTYCTNSKHYVVAYFYYTQTSQWFDPFRYSTFLGTGGGPWGGNPFTVYYVFPRFYRLGVTEACIAIPFPPPPTPTPTPTPTPVPTPSPTPTPCNPLVQGSCFPEQVFVGVASPIRPMGVSNGTNKAGVYVCVCTGAFCGTPLPNRNVELKVIGIPNTGGHLDSLHLGTRPIGKLDKTTGMTGANGCFFTQYNPSHISGFVTVEGKSGNRTDRKETFIGVLGLTQLQDGVNFRIKPNPDTAHPSNNWGSTAAVVSFPRIADAYKTRFFGVNPMPESDKLRITEMSLVSGGKFDLASPSRGIPTPNWHNLTAVHKYHREGNSIDMRCCALDGQIPPSRHAIFRDIVLTNGATDFLRENNPDHFHLSFNGEANNLLEPDNPLNIHTPHSFIENAWEVALNRFATQEEWQVWHDRLITAKAQGQSQFLNTARWLEQEFYRSSEYIARNRSNSEFVEDVFRSHLFREPTEPERAYWLNILQTISISYGSFTTSAKDPGPAGQEERMFFVWLFGEEPEFASLVGGIIDGEVIIPPLPTPTPTP